jgi:curved DNA-binding protein CbpA
MDVDPYKILEVPKNFSLEQLRTQYKKIALSVHPDKVPGKSDYMFKIVTKCYKLLLEVFNNNQSDKQFSELKTNFKKEQEKQSGRQYRNIEIEKQSVRDTSRKFNLDGFNKVFEDNRLKNVSDTGYKEWMEQNQVKDAPSLEKNISADKFNEQFDKYVDNIKGRNNKYIIKCKEPEPMQICKKLGFIELGGDKIDDFSGENRSNRDLNYMDYRIAHSTTRLIDPNVVKQRKDYKNITEYEEERSNIKKLSNKELGEIEKRKRFEDANDKKKQNNQKILDEMTFEQFKKINKMMLDY